MDQTAHNESYVGHVQYWDPRNHLYLSSSSSNQRRQMRDGTVSDKIGHSQVTTAIGL